MKAYFLKSRYLVLIISTYRMLGSFSFFSALKSLHKLGNSVFTIRLSKVYCFHLSNKVGSLTTAKRVESGAVSSPASAEAGPIALFS